MIEWTGEAYRGTSYDVPLWVNPNRRSGRWNIAGEGCTQYLALDGEAPFAEALRHENLRTEAEVETFSTTIWQLSIHEGAVVDYSSFELAEAAGFPADALVDDDHERCQAEAQWLRDIGARGLLVPSAALPGSVNLTLFGPRVAIRWNVRARLAVSIPAQALATGTAPPGLVERVRFYGEVHSGLETYVAR
ncbi:MAG: hypothetical protein QOJ97_860 [Solirubrobacteraceae bacterium]|jgi:RES domain-containing protein|nr:hypothetical protein [Solirubrobacteraceae bacterium]